MDFLDKFASLTKRKCWATVEDYTFALNLRCEYLRAALLVLSGQSADHWIDHYVRIAAYELLEDTDKMVAEISDMLGFSQSSVFSKVCKRLAKYSPTDLRHKLRTRRAAARGE